MSKILSFQHVTKKFLKTNILPSCLCTQSVKSALYCTMKAHLKLDQTHVKGSTVTSGLCSGLSGELWIKCTTTRPAFSQIVERGSK